MSRYKAREEFFKLLFEADIKGVLPNSITKDYIKNMSIRYNYDRLSIILKKLKIKNSHKSWIENIEKKIINYEKIVNFVKSYSENISLNYEKVENCIQKNMKKWKIDRLGTVERCLLRFATYEILYEKEVNYKIAINEAIELSKIYGDEKSPEFINGILAGVVEEIIEKD